MYRHRLIALVALFAVVLSVGGAARNTSAQDKARGQIVRSYRAENGNAPDWATKAIDKSLAHQSTKAANAKAEFKVRSVDQDDLATHVRLDQYLNGVPVFGAQVLTHLDAQGNVLSDGGEFYAVNVNTKPSLNELEAIKVARKQVNYVGDGKYEPEVSSRLVVLPQDNGAAVLAYQVSVHIEDGTAATAHHEYFVNAADGSVAYYYNDIDTVNATGTGKSLYSGNVSIGTDLVSGVYYMRDNTRGGMYTVDMKNRTSGSGTTFSDSDNVWGTNTSASAQSAAVDAHYGAQLTWDYYLNSFNRRGIDNAGFRVVSRVHYGRNYNNAFWNGVNMTYGDGDGSTFTPLTSLDVAGHEITHGLTEKTADLVYAKESGALNESFSDIFGTMVEYASGVNADYQIGEDIYTPGTSGDALRSMSNPASAGDPDHYSKRLYPGTCSPSSTNDNCGVHSNSGIQNHAFYLLAEGGTNRTSGLSVTGIGRTAAAAIFYRTLTVYLSPSSNYSAARLYSLRAAADLYGSGSTQYNAVAQAWTAVGVQ
ncbi:MAG TPA: M4 family metallopeptidase [Herpetosiphonaceae bacterium]|nr:M4 family metallopeptidase [Herpetosiphonaceae bacterium]